jgi:hypothetical protein
MRAMRKLFWPTERISVNALGRLGRVAHWSLVAFAIFALLVALAMFSQSAELSDTPALFAADGSVAPIDPQHMSDWSWHQGSYWLLHSLGALFLGRAIRYILSAE